MVASRLANYWLAIIVLHFKKLTWSYFGLKPKLGAQNRIPTSVLVCIILWWDIGKKQEKAGIFVCLIQGRELEDFIPQKWRFGKIAPGGLF